MIKDFEGKNAAEIMELLMNDGTYPSIKKLKYRNETIKKTIKERLLDSEKKRHEFKRYGLVAKFIPKAINNIDYQALNEYLYDLGLLISTVKIDHKTVKGNPFIMEQLVDYQHEPEFYVKPSFNKLGNSLNKPSEYNVDHLETDKLISSFNPLQASLKDQEMVYESAKEYMLQCSELWKQKKLKHKYGSVSLVAKDPLYDISSIYENLGEEILIKYGKPDDEKIQDFILKGTITQNEIDQFKHLVDIRLDFVLIPLEVEKKMMDMLHNRHLIASQNRRRA